MLLLRCMLPTAGSPAMADDVLCCRLGEPCLLEEADDTSEELPRTLESCRTTGAAPAAGPNTLAASGGGAAGTCAPALAPLLTLSAGAAAPVAGMLGVEDTPPTLLRGASCTGCAGAATGAGAGLSVGATASVLVGLSVPGAGCAAGRAAAAGSEPLPLAGTSNRPVACLLTECCRIGCAGIASARAAASTAFSNGVEEIEAAPAAGALVGNENESVELPTEAIELTGLRGAAAVGAAAPATVRAATAADLGPAAAAGPPGAAGVGAVIGSLRLL